MTTFAPPLTHVSDQDLVAEVTRLAARERGATADLIAALSELDGRRLYLAEGCASLFTYCTERLHLSPLDFARGDPEPAEGSEHAAYHRITAARTAGRFPVILDRLREGALTVTAVGLLAPHLTADNHLAVLDAARYQSKRAVEELVARLHARPDVRPSLRKLPAPRTAAQERGETANDEVSESRDLLLLAASACECSNDGGPVPSPRRPSLVRPLALARYQVQMTVSAETHAKLRRAHDLLRHAISDGDPAAILDRALTLLLKHLERTKCAATTSVRSGSQAPPRRRCSRPSDCGTISPSDKTRPPGRARDGGQCTFVGTAGRCTERGFLEFHHRVPFAAGGGATVDNIAITCRAHNQHEVAQYFAATGGVVARARGEAETSAQPHQTRSGSS